jgi:hypothetical protein
MLPSEVKKETIFIGHPTDILSRVKDALDLRNVQLIRKRFLEDKLIHIYMHNYHLLNHYIVKFFFLLFLSIETMGLKVREVFRLVQTYVL